MDQLPVELLLEIITHCDRTATFRLRGVNKSFHQLITPLVFECVYIGWIPEHLERLECLSKSPIANHVRCVAINTEILPLLKKRDWLEAVKDTICNSGKHSDSDSSEEWFDDENDNAEIHSLLLTEFSESELKNGFKRMRNLALDQQHETANMCSVLINALQRLVNVTRLELIDNRGMHRGYHGRDLPHSPLADCSPWKGTLIDPYSYYADLRDKWGFDYYEPDSSNISSAYVLHYLAESLVLHRKQTGKKSFRAIDQLTFQLGHHIPISEVFEETNCEPCELCQKQISYPKTLKKIYSLFSTLTNVTLRMNNSVLHMDQQVCYEVALGLCNANNLRRLELDNRRAFESHFYSEIACWIPEQPWPKLEHLQISGITSRKDLSKIICSTAQSLRVLQLIDVLLIDENRPGVRWDDFLQSIQPCLSLESAELRYLHDSSHTYRGHLNHILPGLLFGTTSHSTSNMNRQVESFLSKKSVDLPRQEDWEWTNPGRSCFGACGIWATAFEGSMAEPEEPPDDELIVQALLHGQEEAFGGFDSALWR